MNNYTLIIAGGTGTRLWPMSRKNFPKQFQKLVGDISLFTHMVGVAKEVTPAENIFVVIPSHLKELAMKHFPEANEEQFIIEPEQRDNGPAILLGVLRLLITDPEPIITVLWADHYIEDVPRLKSALLKGAEYVAENPTSLVTVGVQPSEPETGYGYIEIGDTISEEDGTSLHHVKSFKEKPNRETAEKFVASNAFLWNTGYKIFYGQHFLDKLKEDAPLVSHIEELRRALLENSDEKIKVAFANLPRLSIEKLYTEKVKEIVTVACDPGWSDVGSWKTLHERGVFTPSTQVILENSSNCYVHHDGKKVVALVGVENLVIVDTEDSLLVIHKDHAQEVKEVYRKLQEKFPHLL